LLFPFLASVSKKSANDKVKVEGDAQTMKRHVADENAESDGQGSQPGEMRVHHMVNIPVTEGITKVN